MRKDQKRSSEEEAGILRRSRWISSNQQKFCWLEGQTSFWLYLCAKLKDVLWNLMADFQSLEKAQKKYLELKA